MAEPTTSGMAVAGMLGAGVSAAVLSAIGVEPQPIFWALLGTTIGLSWAAPTTRMRGYAIFVCTVLASALLGTWAASRSFAGDPIARNVIALLVGAVFQPGLTALVNAAPAIVAGLLRRFGLGGGQP